MVNPRNNPPAAYHPTDVAAYSPEKKRLKDQFVSVLVGFVAGIVAKCVYCEGNWLVAGATTTDTYDT